MKLIIQKLPVFLLIAGLAGLTGCNKPAEFPATGGGNSPGGGKKLTIAFLPKSKGNAYFVSCAKGAQKAADELGDKLIIDGPTDPDPARQNEIVENWITLGVDVIAASCENKEGISTALRKAEAKGIKVVTYDADALPDARSFFMNQATSQGIGYALMDEAARLCESNGEFAVITGSLTAGNQVAWRQFVEERRAAAYPNMKCDAVEACDDLKDKAQSETTALLSTYPNLKLILSTTSLGVPGAAEAIKQAGKTGSREKHRPRPTQRKQALRPRRRDAGCDFVEDRRPRLSHRLCGGCAGQRRAEIRRQDIQGRLARNI